MRGQEEASLGRVPLQALKKGDAAFYPHGTSREGHPECQPAGSAWGDVMLSGPTGHQTRVAPRTLL
jgi:hypothetical protein